MAKTVCSVATCLRIAENWEHAESLGHCMQMSGIKTKDPRKWNKYRRQTEEVIGRKLPSINDASCTHIDIECPTTLDLPKARKHKDFIITSLTNNSPIAKGFLETLEMFTDRVDGQLLVVPIRYYNKDKMSEIAETAWDTSVYKYALTKDLNIGQNLVISGHRMRPTVVNPLAGKQALSGTRSAVYGHPQIALESVATPKSELPKLMMTTGSLNKPVYSATNDGGKAAFNHSIAAIYVKRVGSKFFFIQLMWDGVGFHFLNEYWTPEGVENRNIGAIVHGDSHCDQEIPKVTKSKLRLIDRLKPERQVFHDLHNHSVGSHHNNLVTNMQLAEQGRLKVDDEVKMSIDYIERVGKGTKNYIVGSNHDDHLDQWANKLDPKKDPINARFYGWLLSKLGQGKSALQVCFDEWGCKEHYEFASRNKRLDMWGIDCSQHGDKGPNGSRGSAVGFAKTMLKTMIGHGHFFAIVKGCWQVPTSTDLMEYAQGYSTWMIGDGVIYTNGKRALIAHINGRTIADYVDSVF